MLLRRTFHRSILASVYLEYFMVSAVSSILVIRLFLELTGYPQIGGDSLHIAHMLWGGLLMLISIFLLLSFIGRTIENISAILGGIGFGTFIDEIGKFITQDNNYFFQPSVAIIYVIFILILLVIRMVHWEKKYSSQEFLLNAIRELQEMVIDRLDNNEKRRALEYLSKSGFESPISEKIKEILIKTEQSPSLSVGRYQNIKRDLQTYYQKVTTLPVFNYLIILIFLFRFITQFLYIVIIVFFWGVGWEKIFNTQIFQDLSKSFIDLSFTEVVEIISVSVSGIFTFLGIWFLPKSRLKAFQMFEKSILVSIFFTQVFVFYREEFGALIGLTINLLILFGLKFMIRREINPKTG